MTTVFVFTLIPYAAKIFENSRGYLRQLNLRAKYDRRLCKSLRPLDIEIGPFGRVDIGLLPVVMKYFSDYTSNLLVTF